MGTSILLAFLSVCLSNFVMIGSESSGVAVGLHFQMFSVHGRAVSLLRILRTGSLQHMLRLD
jgi:hypothetical protein